MAGVHRWQFTPEELQNTPSRKAGIDPDKELNYRQQCANLIQDMGQRLNVTQLCINTAIVYMHRFYFFHSFTKFHRNPMASACLFLAAKVEEQPRKLEHVITWYHMCVNRDQGPLDVKSETYLEMAQELVSNENILLQTLGFDISVEHPHQNVVKTCTLVKASKDLAQTSYILATNSLHLTTMCLRIRHTVVACVCIHLACKWSNYQIPCSSEGKQWFEYVDKDTTLAELEELTNDFLTILDNCPSKLKKKILTWKSGTNRAELADEIAASMAGDQSAVDASERKKNQAAAAGSHKDLLRGAPHASHSGSGGMRRVQTEPALAAHGDLKQRSKKPSHPPPTHGAHHREIPGYHGKVPQQHSLPSQHPKHPYSSSHGNKPTHPPPPHASKSRHPGHPQHAEARPSTSSHPGSHTLASGASHPDSRGSSAHPHTDNRANIFDQMQSVQKGGSAAGQEVQGRKPTLPQQQPRVHGAGHHRPQPHGASQRSSHSNLTAAATATNSSQKRNHTEDTRARGSHDPSGSSEPGLKKMAAQQHSEKSSKAWPLEEGEICSIPSSVIEPVSVNAQQCQEREMQEKLQSEMRKQKEHSQRLEKERRERQKAAAALKSPELKSPTADLKSPHLTELKSPRLSSPPVGGSTGHTKSESTNSNKSSDADTAQGSKQLTPTKEERLRLLQAHQNQILQDDRKRLRRLSEELNDPKIEKKPVVMLDNYFTSPEKAAAQEPSPNLSKSGGKNPPGGGGSGDKADVPTPSRTISLEKYRERKPLVQPTTPTTNQASMAELTADKPSLAMEHLASIKLQGLKPLSEILKSSDIPPEASNGAKTKLEAPSPSKKVKPDKMQRHDSKDKLARSAASHGNNSHETIKHSDQSKTDSVKMELDSKLARSSSSRDSHRSGNHGNYRETAVKQESLDSPKKEKNIPSLKIKLGSKPVVTLSPGQNKEPLATQETVTKHHHHHGHKEHHRHEKKPHKHKHRDKSKHRDSQPPTPSKGGGEPEAGGEKLKLKLNLKQLGMSETAASASESPFKIDNLHRSVSGTPESPDVGGGQPTETPGGQSSSATVKLVLQKDRTGHYSSGHKKPASSHSSSQHKPAAGSSRKRVHSPAADRRTSGAGALILGESPGGPAVPIKIPRSDSSASLGFELNGSRSNSPSPMELMQQQARKVEKLIEKQKKNIKKTLEQQGSSTPTALTNSPRLHPQAYPP